MQPDSWAPAPSGSAGLCLLGRSLCKGQRTATPTAANIQCWNDHVIAAMLMGNMPRAPELSIIDHWDELEPELWAGDRHSSLHHNTEQPPTVWVSTSKAWIANSFFIVWREEWGQKLAEGSAAYPALLAAARVSNEPLSRHPLVSKRRNKPFSALGNNWGKSYPLSLLFGLRGWMGDYPFCVISQSICLLSIAFPSYSECTAMWCFPRCLLIHTNSLGLT